jgi:hypothetical protein
MDGAFIVELTSSAVYITAGARLLHLGGRTGGRPERLLGVSFLLMGLGYVCTESPYAIGNEALLAAFSFTGRVLWDIGMLAMLLFNRHVFRPQEAWARYLTLGTGLLLAAGLCTAAFEGDWDGYDVLGSRGFWLEWVGQVIPMLWTACEALAQFSKGRRRLAIGLSDPLVCNRYLLWAGYGLLGVAGNILFIPLYLEFLREGTFSELMDGLVGGCAMLSVATIWVAFFPPDFYRRWFAARASANAGEG